MILPDFETHDPNYTPMSLWVNGMVHYITFPWAIRPKLYVQFFQSLHRDISWKSKVTSVTHKSWSSGLWRCVVMKTEAARCSEMLVSYRPHGVTNQKSTTWNLIH